MDTLRRIADGMEHEPNIMDYHVPRSCLPTCPKCRLEALLAEYEKVDLVKRLRTFAAASDNADWSDGINRSAAELETWLAVNLERIKAESYENGMQAGAKEEALLQRIFDEPGPIKDEIERIKAEARLEEAKWWSSKDRPNGPRTLYPNEKEHLAALEAQAKKGEAMSGPHNREEANKYRYNCWDGNPHGWAYDPKYCAYHVFAEPGANYQCTRKPGYGPDAIFCKQHAKIARA